MEYTHVLLHKPSRVDEVGKVESARHLARDLNSKQVLTVKCVSMFMRTVIT